MSKKKENCENDCGDAVAYGFFLAIGIGVFIWLLVSLCNYFSGLEDKIAKVHREVFTIQLCTSFYSTDTDQYRNCLKDKR